MWILSIVSLAAAAASFSISHWRFMPVGFEGMLWLAGLLLWVAVLCIVGTIAFGGIILMKRRGINIAWPLVFCATAGVLIFLTVYKL
jgi:hypothetical protein